MLLRQKSSGHMIEVADFIDLVNLNQNEVTGCYQEGEEVQDPNKFKKEDLVFLSGESLPRCWSDPHYRDNELKR
ncbi:MAG: acetyltransferase [Gammaproteobacteria bacterium]|nr:acetyltransferase [Gammaproteobacteria bacterium]